MRVVRGKRADPLFTPGRTREDVTTIASSPAKLVWLE